MTAFSTPVTDADAPRRQRAELILGRLDQLPTLPAVAVRLLATLSADHSSTRDVVEIIEADPALTTAVLRLATRADKGVRREGLTVAKAVPLLGFTALRRLVLTAKVFDTMPPRDTKEPDVVAAMRDDLWLHNIAVACAADPFCIGVFSDNELPFGRSVLQIGTYVDAYLTLPAGAPGKLALQAFFEERYGGDLSAFNTAWSLDLASFDAIQDLTGLEPDSGFCNEAGRRADRQAFVARAAARYFAVVDAALEAISPELLYLGTRFLAVYTAPAIYEAAAPHVDVVSINDYDWDENGRGLFRSEGTPYGYLFLDDPVSDLDLVHALTGKPLMITEWTVRTNRTDVDVLFPPFMPTADSQAERADRYEAFMEALLERPYMVGAHWFKFHDQPATGRQAVRDHRDRSHAGGGHGRRPPPLQPGQRLGQRIARRIARPAVIVPARLAKALKRVIGRQIQRRHDRPELIVRLDPHPGGKGGRTPGIHEFTSCSSRRLNSVLSRWSSFRNASWP